MNTGLPPNSLTYVTLPSGATVNLTLATPLSPNFLAGSGYSGGTLLLSLRLVVSWPQTPASIVRLSIMHSSHMRTFARLGRFERQTNTQSARALKDLNCLI